MAAVSASRQFFYVILVLICIFCAPVWADDAPLPQPVLDKVVIVSRHGVRSPTQSRATLAEWSARKWPEWPVSRGYLTERGAWLVEMQWARLAEWFREKGLLSGTCPSPEDIWVYADVDQRTRGTASALLNGLAPNCGLGYVYAGQKLDPVFHPLKAGLCHFEEQQTRRDVLLESGGLEALEHGLASDFDLVGDIAGPAAPALCSRYGVNSPCSVSDLPSYLVFSSNYDKVGIGGGLGIAASLAEIWLLEYAQWPDTPPAWGLGGPELLQRVMPVHMRVFNAVNRAATVAKSQGSALVSRILDALEGTGDKKAAAARVVAFVGHDTNIANIGGMLGLTWQQPGYVLDQTPPGGALMFTLWTLPNGKKRLGIQYVSLSLDGLRAKTPERAKQAVLVSPVSWSYCIAEKQDLSGRKENQAKVVTPASFMPELHSPEAFFQSARRALNMQCADTALEETLLIGK